MKPPAGPDGKWRGDDYEMGVDSLVPIESLQTRVAVWRQLTGNHLVTYIGDLCDADFTYRMIAEFKPAAVVHYAEQRAARSGPEDLQGRRRGPGRRERR